MASNTALKMCVLKQMITLIIVKLPRLASITISLQSVFHLEKKYLNDSAYIFLKVLELKQKKFIIQFCVCHDSQTLKSHRTKSTTCL